MLAESADANWEIMDVRGRLYQHGTSGLKQSELIGLVLGTGATKDAFEVAEQLVNSSGGLLAIARMNLTELKEYDGMGLMKAMQLQAALELGQRLNTLEFAKLPQVNCPADVAKFLVPEMSRLEQQQLRAIYMDHRNRVIDMAAVYVAPVVGGFDVRVADVFREAIRKNACGLIVAHNHTDGDALPTESDIRLTTKFIKAGELLGIEVFDHLVISEGNYVSLRETGLAFEQPLPTEDKEFVIT
jgi:DNA repair protein RadC